MSPITVLRVPEPGSLKEPPVCDIQGECRFINPYLTFLHDRLLVWGAGYFSILSREAVQEYRALQLVRDTEYSSEIP